MIVEIPNYKYKVNSQRGINVLEEPGIVDKLNKIIEWDKCKFPPNLDATPKEEMAIITDCGEMRGVFEYIQELRSTGVDNETILKEFIPDVEKQLKKSTGRDDIKIELTPDGKEFQTIQKVYPENKEYLGNPPSLKPGNCFKFDGQVVAIDKSKDGEARLVLYATDSGPLALDRLKREVIDVELSLQENLGIDLNIINDRIVDFKDISFLKEGETRLDDLELREENDNDLLSSFITVIKLDQNIWRYIMRRFPTLKEDLSSKGMLEIVCAPMLEEISMWIDCKGNLAYDSTDIFEDEWEVVYEGFWSSLWNYLKSKV